MRTAWWRGACVLAAGCVVVACTSAGSNALVGLAAGHWTCAVKDVSAHGLGSFDADTEVTRDHKWIITVRTPDNAAPLKLEGSWQLKGTSVSVRITRSIIGPDKRQIRFDGAATETPAVSVFVHGAREGKFAVAWKGHNHVAFTQTESNGSPSVAGGDGDAWVADCQKA